jgi:hypothetical protein
VSLSPPFCCPKKTSPSFEYTAMPFTTLHDWPSFHLESLFFSQVLIVKTLHVIFLNFFYFGSIQIYTKKTYSIMNLHVLSSPTNHLKYHFLCEVLLLKNVFLVWFPLFCFRIQCSLLYCYYSSWIFICLDFGSTICTLVNFVPGSV